MSTNRSIAVLYPFGLWCYPFLSFPGLTKIDIAGVASTPGQGLSGKSLRTVCKDIDSGLLISDDLPAVINNTDANTLIFGNDKLLQIDKSFATEFVDIVSVSARLHKNFISTIPITTELQDEAIKLLSSRGLTFWAPNINKIKSQIKKNSFKMLLGVFSTGPRSRIFEIQLFLNRALSSKVITSFIGAASFSELFGMPPLPLLIQMKGNDRTVINIDIEHLQGCLHELPGRLIIMGFPYATIPFSRNDKILNFSALKVAATFPLDGFILCINLGDPDSYIIDTLEILKRLTRSEPVAVIAEGNRIIASSFYKLSHISGTDYFAPLMDEQLRERVNKLEELLQLPILKLEGLNTVIEQLATKILNITRPFPWVSEYDGKKLVPSIKITKRSV